MRILLALQGRDVRALRIVGDLLQQRPGARVLPKQLGARRDLVQLALGADVFPRSRYSGMGCGGIHACGSGAAGASWPIQALLGRANVVSFSSLT